MYVAAAVILVCTLVKILKAKEHGKLLSIETASWLQNR